MTQNEQFIESFYQQQSQAFEINTAHGFEGENSNFGEKIALIHGELSEALEYSRKGDPQSEKILGFTGVEEEFADTIIRMMNVAQRFHLRVPEAILAKQVYNHNRPYKHGGKRF